MRRVIAIALGTVVVSSWTIPVQADPGRAFCRDLSIPVAVIGAQTMHGRLCEPPVPTRTALVLVPGGTYNSSYWDLPHELGLHSFRAGMNGAGYATLTVDRLGTGRSSIPPSAFLTTFVQAEAVHQIVHMLRSGSFGPRYDKVIVGGHSLGAAISIVEAANYHDVDGVLVAGLTHHLDLVDVTTDAFLNFYPAALDPQLAGRGHDPGYLTTRPGTRAQPFHNPAEPTPEAIGHDEANKDVFATTEAADAIAVSVMSPYSALVTAPVLLALSAGDDLFCSPLPGATDCSSAEALHRQQAPYYAPEARLETYLFPGNYGHSFNYAPHADQFHRTVASWADRMVGGWPMR